MKVSTQLKEVITDIDNSEEFRLELTPEMFKMMYSTLYSNKIRAIIRELSCNAWDSHVVANNKEKQFDVKLPSSLDNQFWIRDYGTGLSEEQVKSIYSVFGVSTKKTSNELIGCLGIGSKSPFAYTDNFIVTSYHSGKESVYSCFIGENRIPSFAKIHEQSSSEQNGLKIQFSVNQKDISEFYKEANHVFSTFMEGYPNVIHPDFSENNVKANLTKLSDNLYVDFSYTFNSLVIIQGNIAYDIPSSALEISHYNLKFGDYNLPRGKFYLKVDIGDITFTSSRESIEVSDKNKSKLLEIITSLDVQEKLQELFYKQFENIHDDYDYWYFQSFVSRNIYNNVLEEKLCIERGWRYGIYFYIIEVPETFRHNVVSKKLIKEGLEFRSKPSQYQFYIVDESKYASSKIASHKNSSLNHIIIKNVNDTPEVQEFMKKILKFPNVFYTSQLPSPQKKENPEQSWFYKSNGSLWHGNNFIPLSATGVDSSKPFYIIEKFDGELILKRNLFIKSGKSFYDFFLKEGVIQSDTPILIVPSRSFKAVQKHYPNAVNLFGKIIEYVNATYSVEDFDEMFGKSSKTENYGCSKTLDDLFVNIPDAPLAEVYRQYSLHKDDVNIVYILSETLEGNIYDILNDILGKKPVVNQAKNIYDYYAENFPLINCISSWKYSDEKIKSNIRTLLSLN